MLQSGPPTSTPSETSLIPRIGAYCAAPECDTLVLHARFCDGCFADAAKDLCRQIELELIQQAGLEPGSDALKARLMFAGNRALAFYESRSILGRLSMSEAVYLRALTDSACLLVARGGVAALANLPGTRRAASPEPRRGRCDFRALM